MSTADEVLKFHASSGRKSIGTTARERAGERIRWKIGTGHSWLFGDGSVIAIDTRGNVMVHQEVSDED